MSAQKAQINVHKAVETEMAAMSAIVTQGTDLQVISMDVMVNHL